MSLPEWVKGPEFAGWIEENAPDWRKQLNESEYRAMHRMVEHQQARASLKVVDQICVRLGFHINEIPEELWTDPPRANSTTFKGRNGAPTQIRQAVLKEAQVGRPLKEISAKYGVAVSTIHSWRRRAA